MELSHRQPAPARHAFTLVELMFVVILMGILAVSVIPAMGSVTRMRVGAARDDLSRTLQFARSQAMSIGKPVGVRVDQGQSRMELVGIDSAGEVVVLVDPLTSNPRKVNISDSYPGASITDVIGIGGNDTIIWFDFDGTPHTRSNDGSFVAYNDDPVEIVLNADLRVVVHAYSGMVQSP